MKLVAVGLSGKIGSGKSTLALELANTLRCPRVGFGDYVRIVARKLGLSESRETLQGVGESLLAADPEGFCRAVIGQANWDPSQSLIVDGIRHKQVVDIIRQLVAPTRFVLMFVSADDRLRESRLIARDEEDSMTMQQIESHSTEREVASELRLLADIEVDASLPIEGIIVQIRNVVEP